MHFSESLTKARQSLVAPKLITQDESNKNLNELLNSLIMTIVEKVKGVLQDLVVGSQKIYFLMKFLFFILRHSYNQILIFAKNHNSAIVFVLIIFAKVLLYALFIT